MNDLKKKLLIGAFLLPAVSFAATRYEWTFSDKLKAQEACSSRYSTSGDRFASCVLAVTVYGDGRQWDEMGWSKVRAHENCIYLKGGSVDVSAYEFGCNAALDAD
jgi:hypothetical protein